MDIKPKTLTCKKCDSKYSQWYKPSAELVGMPENNLCPKCNDKAWEDLMAIEESDNLKEIKRIESNGHSYHCACRQVWGDSECECAEYKKGYDPYDWMKPKLESG